MPAGTSSAVGSAGCDGWFMSRQDHRFGIHGSVQPHVRPSAQCRQGCHQHGTQGGFGSHLGDVRCVPTASSKRNVFIVRSFGADMN